MLQIGFGRRRGIAFPIRLVMRRPAPMAATGTAAGRYVFLPDTKPPGSSQKASACTANLRGFVASWLRGESSPPKPAARTPRGQREKDSCFVVNLHPRNQPHGPRIGSAPRRQAGKRSRRIAAPSRPQANHPVGGHQFHIRPSRHPSPKKKSKKLLTACITTSKFS